MKADLHIHTSASDGSMAPREVVKWAKSEGLEAIAVTDHDTVSGLDEAKDEAEKSGIAFVPGIELSARTTKEIHILGYNFDYHDRDFLDELERVKALRTERNVQIGKRFAALGVETGIDFEAHGLGRMNMARVLVQKGICRDIAEAFEKYLGPKGAAYCETRRITPIEAVKLIKKFGGFVSLAHPKKYITDGTVDMLIGGLKPFGLDGVETEYPTHSPQDISLLLGKCKSYGLLPTGGSDFHGDEAKNFVFSLDPRTRRALHIKSKRSDNV